jgi:hypothetical protein
MIITSLVILTATYFSSRHYRKKAVNNLSEAGKQKEAQSPRPKLFLGKESYNEKGLKYRTLVWVIVIAGLVLVACSIYFHF